jgi:hypothetical protein
MLIEEGTIQPSENRRTTFVGPRIHSVKERQLKKREITNGPIKGSGQGEIKIAVILISRGTDQVEVPNDKPGKREQRAKSLELSQKGRRECMVGRGVNVCDGKGEARKLGGKDNSEGETIAANGHKREEAGVPGSKDAARAAHNYDSFETREVAGEDGSSDEAID